MKMVRNARVMVCRVVDDNGVSDRSGDNPLRPLMSLHAL